MSLRDHLLDSLKSLPGTRDFHIHVLVSVPRKHNALFLFAHPRPKVHRQDILVLLSEQQSPTHPRVFVSAVEASLYIVPTTSCALLYVCKVDSTGQGASPSPTQTLVRSLITFYSDPAKSPLGLKTLWVHLFARAQSQYLFPNSAEHPSKHPLSDIKLCSWWKRLLTDVSFQLQDKVQSLKQYYLLPGFGEAEATHSLNLANATGALQTTVIWIYGHPYAQAEIPLPCPPNPTNLGHSIPSFDDDPKARFLDEIAYTTNDEGIRSPRAKRAKTLHGESGKSQLPPDADERTVTNGRTLGELSVVTSDDFWERMSFRQECVAGAVTGFFALGISLSEESSALHSTSPQPGQVSSQIVKRVMTSLTTGIEFSTTERSIRGTESLETAVRGLCEGIAKPSTEANGGGAAINVSRTRTSSDSDRHTPEPDLGHPPEPSTPPRRVRRVQDDEIQVNAEPEWHPSTEVYSAHIYGMVSVNNPSLPPKPDRSSEARATTAPVTVLAVRKKKKKPE